MGDIFKAEYAGIDDGICVSAVPGESDMLPINQKDTHQLVSFLFTVPNGVQAMSADIEGLVQTSLNQGILNCSEYTAIVRFSVRSSMDSQKRMLIAKVCRLAESFGGAVAVSGDYPGWAYKKDSPLRDLLTEVYKEQYGKEPVIEAIHAGLECGLFIGKRPGLDCVSLGPQIDEIHTFREKLWISSTQRTWELLKETLRRMK